jgi:hypothetical protein
MKFSPFAKEQRYTQPSNADLARHDLPGNLPYITQLTLKLEGDTLVCAEGEKKAAAIMRHLRIPAFGIGGCQMWRNPD